MTPATHTVEIKTQIATDPIHRYRWQCSCRAAGLWHEGSAESGAHAKAARRARTGGQRHIAGDGARAVNTRPTRMIGVSRRLLDQLTAYARTNGISRSALIDFALEQQTSTPLPAAAFAEWSARRVAGAATEASLRRSLIAARATAARVAEPARTEHVVAEQQLERAGGAADREARRERARRRAKIRAALGLGPRAHLCTLCDAPGHQAARCPTVPYVPRETGSLAECAARAAAAEDLSLRAAGARLGITAEAVRRAWQRLFGDRPTPGALRGARSRARIAELAGAGMDLEQLVEATGWQPHYVVALARAAGVQLVTPAEARRQRIDRAVEVVRAGATIGEAAALHDVGYTGVRRRCRELGVIATAGASAFDDMTGPELLSALVGCERRSRGSATANHGDPQ
jgi:hypothetical protein